MRYGILTVALMRKGSDGWKNCRFRLTTSLFGIIGKNVLNVIVEIRKLYNSGCK